MVKNLDEKFVPKFVSTLNCRKNRSIGKFPREVKLEILYQFCTTNRSWYILNHNSKVVEWVRISKIDVTFRKGYKPQLTDEGTEYGGFSKKFCKEKDIELYAKMSKAKTVFLERSIQSSKH